MKTIEIIAKIFYIENTKREKQDILQTVTNKTIPAERQRKGKQLKDERGLIALFVYFCNRSSQTKVKRS